MDADKIVVGIQLCMYCSIPQCVLQQSVHWTVDDYCHTLATNTFVHVRVALCVAGLCTCMLVCV